MTAPIPGAGAHPNGPRAGPESEMPIGDGGSRFAGDPNLVPFTLFLPHLSGDSGPKPMLPM